MAAYYRSSSSPVWRSVLRPMQHNNYSTHVPRCYLYINAVRPVQHTLSSNRMDRSRNTTTLRNCFDNKRESTHTPMMQQYFLRKKEYPGLVLVKNAAHMCSIVPFLLG